MLLPCVIFRILAVIHRFITSSFADAVTKAVVLRMRELIRKLCGRGVTETTFLSSITLAFFKIQDSNFVCWTFEMLRKL